MEHPTDDTLTLNPDEAKNIQQKLRTFLYYAHVFDPAMLVALNTIASEQLKITQETAKKAVKLLNYEATHPEAITRYPARVMTLHMNSDTSFLSE